jgi:glucosamine--fructose-6-phosphate aminotransferase (isomerizing)
MENCVVVGRGLIYANAFEMALKLMETCYVVAERFSSADFLHGPIAMVEASFPVFLFTPSGVTWPALREMIEKLDQIKAETLVVTDLNNREARALGKRAITIPAKLSWKSMRPDDLYTPIPYIIPGQLLAACLATEKGLNPDHPRLLSKVTQTL